MFFFYSVHVNKIVNFYINFITKILFKYVYNSVSP